LTDWERVELGGEFDCIGPLAQSVLRRHGVLTPPNVHFHLPQLRAARGGSLLTGIGGDEIFSQHGWINLHDLAARRRRPELRDALRLAGAGAPTRLRAVVARRRAAQLELGWLTPDARRAVVHALADAAAAEPVGWRARFDWVLGFRYLELGRGNLELLALEHDVAAHHPLLDPTFAGALAALPRDQRFRSRTDALRRLFPELLPSEIVTRESKAAFTSVLWGERSQAFAERWDGVGVDTEIVDVDALRQRWRVDRQPGPHMLLQSIWLGTEGQSESVE
jgi:asparagine synthase (glutamine-hydrolysing)